MKYKGFIFDFFGVICEDVHLRWIADNGFADRVSELIERYYQYSDIGELSLKELYEKLGELVGRSADEVEKEVNGYIQINAELVEYIRELHKTHKIALCSNATSGYVEKIVADNNLGDLFDHLIISSVIHARKPQRVMFDSALAAMDLRPQEVLFIDDNDSYIKAASELDIDSLKYTSLEELKSKLA